MDLIFIYSVQNISEKIILIEIDAMMIAITNSLEEEYRKEDRKK